jgi:hypothetical protein
MNPKRVIGDLASLQLRSLPVYLLAMSLFTLAIALIALILVPSISAEAQEPGLGLGTQVILTQEHREGVRLVQAFVETGSGSPLVLCTFNENAPGYGGVRLSGLTLFCRQRTVDFGNGPIQGVAILTLLPGTFQPQGDLALSVTVFHEGALFYGDLQSCQGQC